jgi:hypothetical protein
VIADGSWVLYYKLSDCIGKYGDLDRSRSLIIAACHCIGFGANWPLPSIPLTLSFFQSNPNNM